MISKCSKLCNLILRCFVGKCHEKYLLLFNTLVVPTLTYCCVIWRPSSQNLVNKLDKMQRRFLRRVEYRCKIPKYTLALPSVNERFDSIDLRTLHKIVDSNQLDKYFRVVSSSTRRGTTIACQTLAKSKVVDGLFPWRIPRLSRNTVL